MSKCKWLLESQYESQYCNSYLKHKPMLHLPITYHVNIGKCYRLLVAINDPLRFLPGR